MDSGIFVRKIVGRPSLINHQQGIENMIGHRSYTQLTTVFVDTRLSKTKHPRKLFQNFRQSYTSCHILYGSAEEVGHGPKSTMGK